MPPGQAEVSIVIPALNEAGAIGVTLDAIARLRGRVEVIVVDGGSTDATVEIARQAGAHVVAGARGRGCQMHLGGSEASAEVLWFLHADTWMPADAVERILSALERPEIAGGHFGLSFDGGTRPARFLTWMYPRFRMLGLCYGDSGIFVRAAVYREIGGFRPYPIFEDLDLIQRVRRRGRFIHLPCELITSSRRFEGRGFTWTFARWIVMQLLYWAGVPPVTLGRWYRPIRKS